MSHPYENLNVPNTEIGVGQYPPQSAPNQASYDASNFADGSSHIFSMYLEMATEEDKKMVENWKADADGILIFTGLFSAAVATLISVSIQDIRQNPQDTSNFYLANIYQATINPNSSNTSTSPPPPPPPFSPPNYAVWVNALWFMSLVISLTCALLATLLQQWARRYLKITQSRYSPHKRARIRAFFSEGVAKCLLPWTVDTLPMLLHISLSLFFAGLVVFLCNVDLTIFKLVSPWVVLGTALYGCITCMPIIRHDSPYSTPLSLPTWHVVTGTRFFIYRFLRWFKVLRYSNAYYHRWAREMSCRRSLVRGMQKTAEKTALTLSSEIDTRIFMWTFDCLDEDHELERFFSGLPGFRSSKVVKDPLPSLTEYEILKLYRALDGLLDRTFSSDFLPSHVKDRRALTCAKAVDPELTPFDDHLLNLEHTPTTFHILDVILSKYQHSGPVAIGIAKVLRGWGNNVEDEWIVYAQSTVDRVVASQPHDDTWYNFASNELGFPETSLREYAAQGDSLSLVILIYVVRQQYKLLRERHLIHTSPVLSISSKIDAKDTSPELQHKFCALWNQIIREAQDGNDLLIAGYFLAPIRNVYLSLHQETNSAPTHFSASTDDEDRILKELSSYPVCKIPDHLSDSTPHTHDDVVSTTLARTIPHDPDNAASVPSITTPYPPPSSSHTPLPVFTDALPLDNQMSVQDSTQPIGQTTIEGRRIPTTSLGPVTTCAMHTSIEPSGMTQPPTPIPSPTWNVSTSKSPPADIAVAHTALRRAPLDDLNIRSSPRASPTSVLVLGAILPTGGLSFQAATRYDLATSSPDSHSSILATAAEGKGSTKGSKSTEEDASCSTLGVREETTAIADIPAQLQSPLPVADVVVAGRLPRPLRTEHIEHRPPDAIFIEHTAVGHTSSSGVEVPSSSSRTPALNGSIPINSRSQMLTPTASGPSRSWDPSAAVEGEESAKAGLCPEKGKGKPHDDITVTSDVPTRLLPPQPIVDVAMAGPSSRDSLDDG